MMDIAAMSMDLSAMRVMQSVEVSMMKKTMETEEMAAQAMMDMLPPPSNHIFDAYA